MLLAVLKAIDVWLCALGRGFGTSVHYSFRYYTYCHIINARIQSRLLHILACSLFGLCSPCIVADDADLEVAGRRIIWGKCLNSGQSCVAPDYIVCSQTIQSALAEHCRNALKEFFGEVNTIHCIETCFPLVCSDLMSSVLVCLIQFI